MVAISETEQQRLENEKMIPIRQAVLGEWKLVEYQNREVAKELGLFSERLSKNLKFELVDGKLKQVGGGNFERIEGDYEGGVKKLYVEDNHLKTIWKGGHTEDIYIQNGRLHRDVNFCRVVFKRIYEKNGAMSAPVPQRPVPEEKTENLTKEGSQKNEDSWDLLDYWVAFMLALIAIALVMIACLFVGCIYAIVNRQVPIRQDIEGSWKLVDHMNFEGYQKAHDSLNLNFEKFSENLRYDALVDGRLVQTGGGSPQLIEDFPKAKNFDFYEEDNHMKSYRTDRSTEDRYIEDGKLIRVDFFEGGVTKRVYERI